MTGGTRRSAVVRGAVAMALLALGAAGMPVRAASHPAPGVRVERTFLPIVTPPGYHDVGNNPYAMHLALVPAPASSVLYGVDALSPGFVSAYDLDTLRPLSRSGLLLDGTVSAYMSLPGSGGLLVAVSAGGQGQQATEIEQVAWSAGKVRRRRSGRGRRSRSKAPSAR
jgi:hypothetical protein